MEKTEETTTAAQEGTQGAEHNPTPEELEQMRNQMIQHMTEELPLLELQEKYEGLRAKIEMHRFHRVQAIFGLMDLTAQPEEEPGEKDPAEPLPTESKVSPPEPGRRSLRTH